MAVPHRLADVSSGPERDVAACTAIAGLGYAITAFEGVQQHRLSPAPPPTRPGPTCSTRSGGQARYETPTYHRRKSRSWW